MYVEKASERDSVLDTVWLNKDERQQLEQCVCRETTHICSLKPLIP